MAIPRVTCPAVGPEINHLVARAAKLGNQLFF